MKPSKPATTNLMQDKSTSTAIYLYSATGDQKAIIKQEALIRSAFDKEYDLSNALIFSDIGRERIMREKLLIAAINEAVTTILVVGLEKFSRVSYECLRVIDKIKTTDCKLRVASLPSLDIRTNEGHLLTHLSLAMKDREAYFMSEHIQMSLIFKMRRGQHLGAAPYGYRIKSKELEIHPDEAAIIREIFRRYTDLKQSVAEISSYLKGIAIQHDVKNMDTKIRRILKNATYAGWVTSKSQNIQYGELRGTWSPIINDEQFLAAQKRLQGFRANSPQASQTPNHSGVSTD